MLMHMGQRRPPLNFTFGQTKMVDSVSPNMVQFGLIISADLGKYPPPAEKGHIIHRIVTFHFRSNQDGRQ